MDFLVKNIEIKPQNCSIENVNSSNSIITEASDVIYKESKTARGWMSWIVGGFFILMCFVGFLFKEEDYIARNIYVAVFLIPAIFCIVYGFIAPLKYLVYDRLNDTLTVPRNFRSSIDISFSKGHGVRVFTAVRPGTINQHLTFVSSKEKPRVGGIITELQVDDYWAFTVWYMDKNRPLPPGTAFDPYREKDFERRKAEGFPKPLYPSSITTNEATREQQKERERIGGW